VRLLASLQISSFYAVHSARESIRLVPKGCCDWIPGERDTSKHLSYTDSCVFSTSPQLYSTSHISSSTLTKFLSEILTLSNGLMSEVPSVSGLSMLRPSKEGRRTMERRFTLRKHRTETPILLMFTLEKLLKGSMVSTDADIA